MSEQLPNIKFTGFKSVNEITQPEKLSSEELVILDNMRLDELAGVPTTRKGFSQYNQQVDTVAGGNINSIFDVQDQNENDFLLVAIGTKLRKSANGSGAYSDLKTGLTNNAKMRMAPYGGKFLFTNGNDAPFYADSNNFWAVNNMALPTPDVSGVATNATGGSGTVIGNDIYKYILIYVTADGQYSNASCPISLEPLINAPIYQIALTGLPNPSDTRIQSILLLRTMQHQFELYYLVATLIPGTTSYTDVTPDNQLDTTVSFPNPGILDYMNTPNTAGFICANNNRIFLANILKQYINRVLPPPIITSQITDPYILQSGLLTNNLGAYQWGYSFVDMNGNESALVSFFSIPQNGLSSQEVIWSYFPIPWTSWTVTSAPLYTTYLDANIKAINFYRTKQGGTTFYNVGSFNFAGHTVNAVDATDFTIYLESFTFTDNMPDLSLLNPYPASKHGSTETALIPYAMVWSDINSYLNFEETNYDEVYPDDGDPITGIFDDDNSLVIFKQKSICRFFANGDQSSWYSQKIVENIGCDSPNSIYKLGHSYFFVYLSKCYVFDGASAQEISYTRKKTFDSVTAFLGGTYWNDSEWYVLSVQIGTAYYLLCYDTKLKTWYKFSISKADTIAVKEFGQDAGKLLFGGNLFITFYNENQIYDSDTGSKVDILVQLQTKNYTFPDDFIRARLLFFFVNYVRLHGTSSNEIVFSLTDPKTNVSINFTDEYDSEDELIWKIATDGMQGRLRRANKINFSFNGTALSQFITGRLDYNPETWGNKFKHPPVVQGIGMNTGTKTGVNE